MAEDIKKNGFTVTLKEILKVIDLDVRFRVRSDVGQRPSIAYRMIIDEATFRKLKDEYLRKDNV